MYLGYQMIQNYIYIQTYNKLRNCAILNFMKERSLFRVDVKYTFSSSIFFRFTIYDKSTTELFKLKQGPS